MYTFVTAFLKVLGWHSFAFLASAQVISSLSTSLVDIFIAFLFALVFWLSVKDFLTFVKTFFVAFASKPNCLCRQKYNLLFPSRQPIAR